MNRSLFATIICTLFILQIIVAPRICIDSALSGTKLFMSKVFPSLFPFLVITGVMLKYDGVKIYSKIFGNILCRPLRLPKQCTFAIIVSILCGYPLGAKYACDLYEKERIDIDTCQRLINIASNTSPLFAIGAVGTSMLSSSYLGYFLLIINYLSCFAMSLILPVPKTRDMKQPTFLYSAENTNFGSVMKATIEDSIITCLSIGGFVILYSVLISIISSNWIFNLGFDNLGKILGLETELLKGTFLGLIEMTNGCSLISTTSVHMYIKVIIISFMLGFSGFSIISQVHSFTYKFKLSMNKYIAGKFIQGLMASAIAVVLYKTNMVNASILTFNNSSSYGASQLFKASLILLLLPFLINKLRGLFHTP